MLPHLRCFGHDDDNQGIGSIELFAEQTEQKSYGTFELNQFVLDGSKSVLTENPKDIAFWNDALSKEDCTFETDPKITVTFQEQHTSAAITLYFEDEPPAELKNHMVYNRRYKINHRNILPGQPYLCLQ